MEIFWDLLLKINENETKFKNLQKLKDWSGKMKEMHAGFPGFYFCKNCASFEKTWNWVVRENESFLIVERWSRVRCCVEIKLQ